MDDEDVIPVGVMDGRDFRQLIDMSYVGRAGDR
jgi:hypothetical protein